MNNWEKFKHGQLLIRVDGGPAGVYYCCDVNEYQDAIGQVIAFHGTGLYTTSYYTHEGKPYESDNRTN